MLRHLRPAAILASGLVIACGQGTDRPAQAPEAPQGPRPAPGFAITRSDGQVFDLAEQRGKVVLLFFGYTHCPDVCPTTLADFASVRRQLGPRAEGVSFVFVSVDPARDTPEATMNYARAFDRTFIGLATDSASLAPIMRGFAVGAYKEPGTDPENYTVAHTAVVFIIDAEGRVADRIGFAEARADDLLQAVERVLE
jgi:protein SCO1/2